MERSESITRFYDEMADKRDAWIKRSEYFYQYDWNYMRYLIPKGSSVLEIGCGTGKLLDSLAPDVGVGIDISSRMIKKARSNFPELHFFVGNAEKQDVFNDITESGLHSKFEYVVLSDAIGLIEDCQALLERVRQCCDPDTRLIIAHFGYHWIPILGLATLAKMKMPHPPQNWLSPADISNFLDLSGFQVVSHDWAQLLPVRAFGLGDVLNRFVASLPLFRRMGIRNYVVARLYEPEKRDLSASIVIPCRNEHGNIEAAVKRLPNFCNSIEIIFVEGHSEDSTFEECKRVQSEYKDHNILVLQQPGVGKGDAVRAGFEAASGDILFILDADLTVPPEQMPKFYDVITSGQGEFVNGSRLVYPVEGEAMRFLNLLANWAFARIFSYLLNQRITDTLCGTKVLRKSHYKRIADNRSYFGNLDPFGDFDLIFGAAKLNLKLVEVPIRYASRTYGSTQISRFSHGWLLLKMVLKAYTKIKTI